MKTNLLNRITSISFATIMVGFFVMNLVLPDGEFTDSERRRLAQAPAFTMDNLFSGKLFQEFDKYSLDQFPLRDTFRGMKAFGSYYLFQQKDNNGIYVVEGNISKMVGPLNEKAILAASDKINDVHNRYLKGKNIHYSVIPDKNYFLAEQNGFLSMDYERILEILDKNLTDIAYIDLFNSLTIEDYYLTDIHWRQERLIPTAEKILEGLGSEKRINEQEYEIREEYPFYGSLHGQSALPMQPEALQYLTNSLIEACQVYDYETKSIIPVYVPEKVNGMDPYDIFLSGAKPLLKITNENAATNKELVLFRDSFGSSIAPLFLEQYASVTLVDLRYMASDILGDYIDFSKDQDILFLYNTQLLNSGYLLK